MENLTYTFKEQSDNTSEIVRIAPDGRIYWNWREIETDDEFRSAMLELSKCLRGGR